ncbi:sce7726 family protein [Loktanella salsilacus]|uniref:sce7726 family protein n=1 Tax=Loktanella salsilacus TaxID=195913 RepID=UPI003703CF30
MLKQYSRAVTKMEKGPMVPPLNSRSLSDGTEVSLRLALVNRLRNEFHNSKAVFAAEARYGAGDRRADFISLTDVAHAFEIKSSFDSLARLPLQILDYANTFDLVTVVTTTRHLQKAQQILPRKTGLWLYDAGALKVVRAASRNHRLSKVHLASGCNKLALISALDGAKTAEHIEALQVMAVKKLKLSVLRDLFHNELQRRYAVTSEHFIQETDSELAAEDLLLLRRAYKIAA